MKKLLLVSALSALSLTAFAQSGAMGASSTGATAVQGSSMNSGSGNTMPTQGVTTPANDAMDKSTARPASGAVMDSNSQQRMEKSKETTTGKRKY